MKTYIKFNCVYCGQHIECESGLRGRRMHCPSCKVPIVIPVQTAVPSLNRAPLTTTFTWATDVPEPELDAA